MSEAFNVCDKCQQHTTFVTATRTQKALKALKAGQMTIADLSDGEIASGSSLMTEIAGLWRHAISQSGH
jgi:hypothetical protein